MFLGLILAPLTDFQVHVCVILGQVCTKWVTYDREEQRCCIYNLKVACLKAGEAVRQILSVPGGGFLKIQKTPTVGKIYWRIIHKMITMEYEWNRVYNWKMIIG